MSKKQNEIITRANAFKDEYIKLASKYQVDCVAVPVLRSDINGGFKIFCNINVVDKKYANTKKN